MAVTYGYDLKEYSDDLIEAPVEINKILAQSVLPGAVLINYIPFSAETHQHFASFKWLMTIFSNLHPFLDPIPRLRENGAEM